MSSRNVDDGRLVPLTTRIPRGVSRRMREFCASTDLRVQTFVRGALSEKLARARRRRA